MNAYMKSNFPWAKPTKVKEWAIDQLKKGSSPKKIAKDIEKLYGIPVTTMAVYRWRNKYIAATGENIPSWFKLNQTAEQKNKNKARYK